jgi:hypothetical protein
LSETNEIPEIEINGKTARPTYWVEGGLGKHVMFTSIIPDLVKSTKHKKINIISAYKDVFFNNELVENSWSFDDYHVSKEKLQDNIKFIKNYEPYKGTFSLRDDLHLVQDWADGMGSKYGGNLPSMNPNDDMKEKAQSLAKAIKDDGKEIVIVQFSGGQPPIGFEPKSQYQNNPQQQQRNYPYVMARHLMQKLKAEYPNIHFVDFTLPNENPGFPEAERIEMPYVCYHELLKHSLTFISIDSSLAHMGAAANKKGIVIWGGTKSNKFGWGLHDNITNYHPDNKFNEFDPFYVAVDYNFIVDRFKSIVDPLLNTEMKMLQEKASKELN